ncbi:MAG TPA: hypothetical protein GX497_08835 [Bacillus bacterium]|nr:hypothetical protein [Bacillus sp. (in: firmicutes)]
MSRISSVFLPTNEYLGILWAFAGVKDAVVINHGTSGCNFYELVTASKRTRELIFNRFASTGLEQEDIALSGGDEKLKAAITEMAARNDVSLIVIVANPVAALIGVDIEAIAREAGQHIKQPILTFNNKAWKENAENGVEEAIYELIRHYCSESELSEQKGRHSLDGVLRANIIGPTAETFNWDADEKEIKRLLDLIGIEVNTVLTYETTTEQLKSVPDASLNIVTRAAGLKTARYLEEHYGIPYIYGLPYGEKGTGEWLKQVAEAVGKEGPSPRFENDRPFSFHHYIEMIAGGEFYQRNWITALSCPPAMAMGLVQLVKEDWHFPLVAVRLTTPPKANEIREIESLGVEKVLVTPGEREWKQVLEESQPFILLGSAEDTSLAGEVPVQLRITEPAYDCFSIFEGNPIVGWEGYQSLTQDLFNQISRYALRKKMNV